MRNYKGKTVEQFLEMLIAERGASSNTCTSYLNDISNFDKFLSGAETTLEDATTDDVRRYLRHRSEVGANNPTISRNLSVLRQFFKFLQNLGYSQIGINNQTYVENKLELADYFFKRL